MRTRMFWNISLYLVIKQCISYKSSYFSWNRLRKRHFRNSERQYWQSQMSFTTIMDYTFEQSLLLQYSKHTFVHDEIVYSPKLIILLKTLVRHICNELRTGTLRKITFKVSDFCLNTLFTDIYFRRQSLPCTLIDLFDLSTFSRILFGLRTSKTNNSNSSTVIDLRFSYTNNLNANISVKSSCFGWSNSIVIGTSTPLTSD